MTKNSCPVFRDARRRRLLFPRPFVAFNTRCYGVLVRDHTHGNNDKTASSKDGTFESRSRAAPLDFQEVRGDEKGNKCH